jgi:peptidoglycan/xylan/chitin deacetylase (PgdA/CDA1 family)
VRFVSFRLVDVGARAELGWSKGLRFTLPHALVERIGVAHLIDANGDLALPPAIGGMMAGDCDYLRTIAAFTDTPPLSSRLPIGYQAVPGWARAAIASLVGRRQRRRVSSWAAFPGWPLDLSADLVADLAAVPRSVREARCPVLLTHDIDSPEGLRNLLERFLPIEEGVGARSTSFIVPCAWTLDAAAIGEIARRGHEIGVHGYDHSNRTPFAGDEERRRRLDAARPFAEAHAAVGYRAPSLLRTRALLRDLAPRYRYDSSIPTSGGLFPVANNGCASARPFSVEGIVELPLSLPRDGSLRFLGYAPREIFDLWIACAGTIAASGGVLVLLTHCEARFSGGAPMLDVYRRFVEYVASMPERFAFSTAASLLPRLTDVHAV